MKFEGVQRYDAPAREVFDLYCSAELYEQLPDFSRVSRPELVDRVEHPDGVTIRARYRFVADLPAAALAIIDPARMTWVEETRYDAATLTGTTRLLPDHYASKMQASATVRFVDDGGGSHRRVSGDLKVKVLLVGGQVERVIVDGLEEHLTEEQRVVAGILAR